MHAPVFSTLIMTESCLRLVNNRFGYRDNLAYGSNTTSFREALKFETEELENEDIYYTLNNFYGQTFNKDGDNQKAMEDVLSFCSEMLKCPIDDIRCLWLCSTESEAEFYGNDISKYLIKGSLMVVSDLGKEGLFVISDTKFEEGLIK